LKNVVERISVIEENREITAAVLQRHLPNISMEKLPAILNPDDKRLFNNEREILYQVLFDMKKDINDLKKLVHDIMDGNLNMAAVEKPAYTPPAVHQVHQPFQSPIHESTIQDAETVEEALSLEDVEKEMIRKALERHNGRRKNAAADLHISERTLYRKIKEYEME